MQPTGIVLLNDKDTCAVAPPRPSCRLGCFSELSLPLVLFEWHSRHSAVSRMRSDAVFSKRCIKASPEGIQLFETPNMLSEFSFATSQIPFVPT